MKKNLVILFVFFSVLSCFAQQTIELHNWKFSTGDNLEWAKPGFDNSTWKSIIAGHTWESQGYTNYNGYAWYLIKFMLPSKIKENARFKDSLCFMLGKIDDCDQTFLNGKLIGQNTRSVLSTNAPILQDLSKEPSRYAIPRKYALPVNDPRLRWDKENVLAIRVYDSSGDGGMSSLPVNVRMKSISDYLVFDLSSKTFENLPDGSSSKTIILKNLSSGSGLKGKLTMQVENISTRQTVALQTIDVSIKNEAQPFSIRFKNDITQPLRATYTFVEPVSGIKLSYTQYLPYILTPEPSKAPKINGAKMVGTKPGSPFLYRIPATGIKPMSFAAENLPDGLVLDANTGIITGNLQQAGEYIVKLTVKNSIGSYSRNLKIVAGNRLALTPPMGWNSWNCFGLTINEDKVRATADIFVRSGLADYGWTYINIDDGWQASQRDPQENILPNEKFKDMKSLTSYIHDHGLKAGIYSSPGPQTCGLFLGSYQHETKDAHTFADWGFDYLKYDWCSYSEIIKDHNRNELQKPYKIMQAALNQINRNIVYSLCQYGMGDVWMWGDSVGGNAWRTTSDIKDTWESMSHIGFNQVAGAPYAKPGNWNDPDMLVVGWVGAGWGEGLHQTNLTPCEQYTHISLWALLSAPLLIGCDLTRLDAFTFNLLTNDEIIDIDQDPLGKQAVPVVKTPQYQVWVKELEDGSKAIGLFNLSENAMKITALWSELQLNGKQTIRDVWRQKDLGVFAGKFESMVLPHGVTLIKATK